VGVVGIWAGEVALKGASVAGLSLFEVAGVEAWGIAFACVA
jgi:hypothetical protein